MAKESLNGEQVGAVFIQMGAKSMPEGMAGETLSPTKPAFMLMDMAGEEESINRLVSAILFGEEEAPGPAISEPVLSEDVKSSF